MFPHGISIDGSSASSPTIGKLRELLDQVQEIKIHRENIEKELKKVNWSWNYVLNFWTFNSSRFVVI